MLYLHLRVDFHTGPAKYKVPSIIIMKEVNIVLTFCGQLENIITLIIRTKLEVLIQNNKIIMTESDTCTMITPDHVLTECNTCNNLFYIF